MGSDRVDDSYPKEDATPKVGPKSVSPLTEDPRPDVWSQWQGAVLGKDEIAFYATECKPPLIEPWDANSEKPASYHLHLGSCCRIMGEDRILTKSDPLLILPPFAVAVVSSFERINIPAFLIARWNLRVQKVYYGLFWTGSLQVDPGYSGHLFCPIFNLSTDTVTIEYGEPLFTIDFVRTTGRGGLLSLERKTASLEALGALDKTKLRSGLADHVADTRERVTSVEKRVSGFQDAVVVVLSVVITAIAILAVVASFGKLEVDEVWGWGACFGLSIVAVVAGITALLMVLLTRRGSKKRTHTDK